MTMVMMKIDGDDDDDEDDKDDKEQRGGMRGRDKAKSKDITDNITRTVRPRGKTEAQSSDLGS